MPAFTAATVISPRGAIDRGVLLVDGGTVVSADPAAAYVQDSARSAAAIVDFGRAVIAPGYFDLHIHGGGGFDVMDDDADALPAIERLLARHGVTSYLPTTVTAPLDTTLRALERLAGAIEAREIDRTKMRGALTGRPTSRESFAGRAQPLGIHLEGPFISHARRGVHPLQDLLPPTISTLERLWQAARGRIRMMTIAPELDGAIELIAAAVERGVCVSLGHSDADFETTERAIAAGARHSTHTFNAMRPLGHRDPGIIGSLLTNDLVTADLIADGIHLDPAIVKLIAHTKGREKTVVITDAISATGKPDGRYHLGSMEVEVKGGRCESGGKLAGSVLTMDAAVRNLAKFAGWELSEAVATASRNPALVLGSNNKGVLAPGADADFLVLDCEGRVLRTFAGGMECLS